MRGTRKLYNMEQIEPGSLLKKKLPVTRQRASFDDSLNSKRQSGIGWIIGSHIDIAGNRTIDRHDIWLIYYPDNGCIPHRNLIYKATRSMHTIFATYLALIDNLADCAITAAGKTGNLQGLIPDIFDDKIFCPHISHFHFSQICDSLQGFYFGKYFGIRNSQIRLIAGQKPTAPHHDTNNYHQRNHYHLWIHTYILNLPP